MHLGIPCLSSFDLVLHMMALTGRKVASSDNEIWELTEYFSVSFSSITHLPCSALAVNVYDVC